jgi:hypothetical protein
VSELRPSQLEQPSHGCSAGIGGGSGAGPRTGRALAAAAQLCVGRGGTWGRWRAQVTAARLGKGKGAALQAFGDRNEGKAEPEVSFRAFVAVYNQKMGAARRKIRDKVHNMFEAEITDARGLDEKEMDGFLLRRSKHLMLLAPAYERATDWSLMLELLGVLDGGGVHNPTEPGTTTSNSSNSAGASTPVPDEDATIRNSRRRLLARTRTRTRTPPPPAAVPLAQDWNQHLACAPRTFTSHGCTPTPPDRVARARACAY